MRDSNTEAERVRRVQVTLYESFEAVPEEVVRIASFPAVKDFFRSFQWFACIYRTSVTLVGNPRIYVVTEDNGTPLASLYCYSKKNARALHGLANFYTIAFGITRLYSSVNIEPAALELASYLAAERPRWTKIDLRTIREDDEFTNAFLEALNQVGFVLHKFRQTETLSSYIGNTTFSEYFGKRPSRVRHTLSRKQRALQKRGPINTELIEELGPSLERGIATYSNIYGASWKTPEPFPLFIPTLARLCAELGLLRLGVLSVGDRPAAAQIWITSPERAVIYKLAYDKQLQELSPGTILTARMFEQAIDTDHVSEISFGVGGEAYKFDWMDQQCGLIGVLAFNRASILGLSWYYAEQARGKLGATRRRLRDAVRRIPNPVPFSRMEKQESPGQNVLGDVHRKA